MLALIDKQLRQAFSKNKNETFGRLSIIMFGDFGQLPPVLDLPIYTTNMSRDTTSNNGVASYNNFEKCINLKSFNGNQEINSV